MNVLVFIIVLITFNNVQADIFVAPDDSEFIDTANQDEQGVYFQGNFAYSSGQEFMSKGGYEMRRQGVSLGCNRYDFHESLKNYMLRPEFDVFELEQIMHRLASSKLLVWQYSSPSVADMYKHLYTAGQMRLGMRYQQCEDLERTIDDPLTKLRKQSIMECIRRIGGLAKSEDMDAAFKACFEHVKDGSGVNLPFESLADPQNGAAYVKDTINLTEKVIERLNADEAITDLVNNILPRVMVDTQSVTIRSPRLSKERLSMDFRNDLMGRLKEAVRRYQHQEQYDEQILKDLSMPGVPMTKAQLVNISLLDEKASYMAMHQLVSNVVYLKVIERYSTASRMLDMVLMHPAIEPGYKRLLTGVVEFPQKQIQLMREERDRLNTYYQVMGNLLMQGNAQRDKTAQLLNDIRIHQQTYALKDINP